MTVEGRTVDGLGEEPTAGVAPVVVGASDVGAVEVVGSLVVGSPAAGWTEGAEEECPALPGAVRAASRASAPAPATAVAVTVRVILVSLRTA